MAIFGRNTARQRLRRATRESLKIPAFSPPVDCTPWVTGGLWPAELSTVTAETAPLVKYLKADLQKIVNSANEELLGIRRAGLADPIRQAEESRVINGARAFAVRRVESTVRHLRNMKPKLPAENRPVNGADDTEKTRRLKAVAIGQTDINASTSGSPQPDPEYSEQGRRQGAAVDQHGSAEPVDTAEQATLAAEPVTAEPEQGRCQGAAVDQHGRAEPVDTAEQATPAAEPVTAEPKGLAPTYSSDSADTEVLEEISTLLQEIATIAGAPVDESPKQPAAAGLAEALADEPRRQPATARHAKPPVDDAVTTRHPAAPVEPESERQLMERLLKFVARQEPGLRWAIGKREDGTTVLVTDLAHGWIPAGITLPAEVRLLEPARRTGNAAALLGHTMLSATYAPSDPLGWAADYDVTETSSQPRELPAVADLGWVLSEAAHWRDGLPRMVYTLAKAGAAGTGVVEAEIDLLRGYLDTSRHQLLAQYPDVDAGLLLNCLLLAATEGIATGNLVHANYHFAWFQMLSAPPARRWKASA